MEIAGKVHKILDLVSGTSTNGEWKKREFVINTTDQYPKSVFFSVWGEKTNLLDNLKANDDVKVFFDPSSREYNERWYTDLRAWRIEKLAEGESSNSVNNGNSNANTNTSNNESNPTGGFTTTSDSSQANESFDDLPF